LRRMNRRRSGNALSTAPGDYSTASARKRGDADA
jgi:hypothetical protein